MKIESHLHGDMQELLVLFINIIARFDINQTKMMSEIPCRVSSDLHEWRNDGHAVSTRDSVKLKSQLRCCVPAARRKDPVNLYYSFTLDFEPTCVG